MSLNIISIIDLERVYKDIFKQDPLFPTFLFISFLYAFFIEGEMKITKQ